MRQEHSGKTFRNDGSLKAGCHAKQKKKKAFRDQRPYYTIICIIGTLN